MSGTLDLDSGTHSLDIFGGDLVRFIDRVIQCSTIVCGLSSSGTARPWLSAFAAPGQVVAAVYEDAPLFASEADPAVGHSIRQAIGTYASPLAQVLGPQWTIGDFSGMTDAMHEHDPATYITTVTEWIATLGPPADSGVRSGRR